MMHRAASPNMFACSIRWMAVVILILMFPSALSLVYTAGSANVAHRVTKDDFLQTGIQQVAAGYIVYGSSTMLVYATRRGVNGFTLDPSIGEFCLSHPNIKCPEAGQIYSVNHGNFFQYSIWCAALHYLVPAKKKKRGGPYTQRYIGSMVADVHRNLIKGGIFMYPGTTDKPSGKLRLMYECNPFAFIVEVAGGRSSNGTGLSIFEVPPESLHQRAPFFVGSKNMMDELETCLTAQ